MKSCDVKAMLLQTLNRQIHHSLGVAKNDGLVVNFHPGQKATENPQFVGTSDSDRVKVNWRYVQFLCVGQHEIGVVHEFMSGIDDFLGEGGREEEGLFSTGHALYDPHDVGEESHVKHAVSFVQAHHLWSTKVDVATFTHVHHTARCPHDDINALTQRFGLLLEVGSAVDGQNGKACISL